MKSFAQNRQTQLNEGLKEFGLNPKDWFWIPKDKTNYWVKSKIDPQLTLLARTEKKQSRVSDLSLVSL